jgi:lipid II:glycine glycyltransferase (peptidoglycan interpeptide bridge formation enzyme)
LFQELDYYKLRDNIYFESLLPRFNPVIQLPNFTLGSIEISQRKNIEKNLNRGIKLIKGEYQDLEFFDKFLTKRDKIVLDSYKDYYREFSKKNMIDILLLEIDLKDYLEYLTSEYENEKVKNEITNNKLTSDPSSTSYYSVKIVSDMRLSDLNTEIRTLNAKVQGGIENEVVGASLVIKYEGRINILETATNDSFSYLETKQFLYYKLIEEYKKRGYTFLDMNGITGDFSESNPYIKLNKFKESFNPNIYEYIGEFDLIINKALYQYLLSSNKLSKEFEKKE